MRVPMNDTDPDIEKVIIQMISRRTPAERLRMASSMFETGKRLVIAGLLQENPSFTKAQIRGRTFTKLYGDCFSPEEIVSISRNIPDIEFDQVGSRSAL